MKKLLSVKKKSWGVYSFFGGLTFFSVRGGGRGGEQLVILYHKKIGHCWSGHLNSQNDLF